MERIPPPVQIRQLTVFFHRPSFWSEKIKTCLLITCLGRFHQHIYKQLLNTQILCESTSFFIIINFNIMPNFICYFELNICQTLVVILFSDVSPLISYVQYQVVSWHLWKQTFTKKICIVFSFAQDF